MDCRSQWHCDTTNRIRRRSSHHSSHRHSSIVEAVANESAVTMVEVMIVVVIAVMVVTGEVVSAVMSVGIDTTPRTDKGRASTRAKKGPATPGTTKSKTTTRSNGNAPGATAKRSRHYGHVRRYWHGRWWAYGVGSCWRITPDGYYVWVCG